MAVTNYTLEKCKYNFSKLKNVLYLVSQEHVKDVNIDNGEAYISGLTELPLRINGFNIQYTEETSLDERYKFQKKITLSMKGYVNYKLFGGRYYAIIEDNDGIYYMVNVDFPSRITHTFNLSQNTNQTDFTFASLSNFPTLKLNADFQAEHLPCIGFNVYGIKSLKLINKDYARLDTNEKKVIVTDNWQNIEFLGKSCSFQEIYDGENVTDTITFDIPFNHKIGWSWNLLEFLDNRYASTIIPIGADNVYYSGFNFGLQPSYTISTSSNNGDSDIITVTLVEMSNYGTTAAIDYSEEDYDITYWRYVKWVDEIKCYECVGYARARYLVQQEVDSFGNPTGYYKVKDGYQNQYQMLNVIDTFNNDEQFNDTSCAGDSCQLNTNMPDLIVFPAESCYTYSLSASCNWNVSNIPSYITVSPTSGVSDSAYTVTVCNTSSVISGQTGTFNINYGNSVRIENVFLSEDSYINPTIANITCLEQNVTFTFDSNCPVTVTSNPSGLQYQITNSNLIVSVPKNENESSGRTFTLTVRNCQNKTQQLTINQDKVYTKWVSSGYICASGNSYVKEVKYTGTSTSNYVMTDVYRQGSLITSGDTRCNQRITKWEFDGNYYCSNGNKYQAIEEFESYDSGSTWTKTWNTRLGNMVESASSFCNQSVSYKWEVNYNKWQCEGQPQPTPSGYSGQYLTFIPTNVPTKFAFNGNSATNLKYSLDGGSTWTSLALSAYTPYVAVGQKIMWKADAIETKNIGNASAIYSNENFYSYEEESYIVEGNIMSLISGDNFISATTISNDYQFASIFISEKIINAENLVLPATTLRDYCYESMFGHCMSLTKAPSLPATALTEDCYASMFALCFNLIKVPSLPATTLANSCYLSMFSYCTSLTTAPELPATTLAGNCYSQMFENCTSLTTAPVLSATTLTNYCYREMFENCTNLRYIKCLATNISATGCTNNWVRGINSTGTFVKASGMSGWTTGNDGIPSNWTIQNA